MPTTRTRPRDAVHEILVAAAARGLALSTMTCVAGTNGVSVYLVTTPHATWAQAVDLFTAFGAPMPAVRDTGVIATETPRLAGPIPQLDVTSLSIAVQP